MNGNVLCGIAVVVRLRLTLSVRFQRHRNHSLLFLDDVTIDINTVWTSKSSGPLTEQYVVEERECRENLDLFWDSEAER